MSALEWNGDKKVRYLWLKEVEDDGCIVGEVWLINYMYESENR